MHITLYRGYHDFRFCRRIVAPAFLFPAISISAVFSGIFHVRLQDFYGFFHDSGRFYHLRQKHFSFREILSDSFHTGHESFLDDFYRAALFVHDRQQVGFDIAGGTFYQGLSYPFFCGTGSFRNLCRRLAPLRSFRVTGYFRSEFYQSFRRIGPSVENYIFDSVPQFRLDIVVNLKHRRIYYGHI